MALTKVATTLYEAPTKVVTTRSVTTSDTATTADEVLILSGASFTQDLYTAVGNTGRLLTLIHNGTSLTQKYTLATASGQTIGGIASGSYILCTAGETLKIVSNGSNWVILDHRTNTDPTAYTPSFGAGLGTCTSLNFAWWREGRFMCIRGFGVAGTVTTAEASFSIPSATAIDSTMAGGTQSQLLGDYFYSNASSYQLPGLQGPLPIIHSTADNSKLYLSESVDTDETFFRDETANALIGTNYTFTFSRVRIPISDWQP
jgi:hypothetical protein